MQIFGLKLGDSADSTLESLETRLEGAFSPDCYHFI